MLRGGVEEEEKGGLRGELRAEANVERGWEEADMEGRHGRQAALLRHPL